MFFIYIYVVQDDPKTKTLQNFSRPRWDRPFIFGLRPRTRARHSRLRLRLFCNIACRCTVCVSRLQCGQPVYSLILLKTFINITSFLAGIHTFHFQKNFYQFYIDLKSTRTGSIVVMGVSW